MYIITLTYMSQRRAQPEDPKSTALRQARALHPHPETVQDEVFRSHEFFDRRDRMQVKYEMLRRHGVDARPVTEVATAFGVSRQAFYTAEGAFRAKGLPGLLPQARGPKRAHKCTEEILDFAKEWRFQPKAHAGASLQEAIVQRFGVRIHPRSLARAEARREKKHHTPEQSVS